MNDIEKEIEQAGKGVKLAPVEVTMAGVTITLMAPADSRAWSNGGSAGVDDASFSHFNLSIRAGKIDHAVAKEIWKVGPTEKITALLIDTKDLVLREFTLTGEKHIKDGTYYRITLNRNFGHLDVYFTNTYSTREDCLLMLKCADRSPQGAVHRTGDARRSHEIGRDGATQRRPGHRRAVRQGASNRRHVGGPHQGAARPRRAGPVDAAITDDGLRALADMKNLRRLSLPFRQEFFYKLEPDNVLNGSGLAHLAGLGTLEELYAGNMAVSDDALKHLKEKGGKLKKLDLMHAPLIGSGFAELAGLQNLQYLNLRESHFGDDGVKYLNAFAKLETLNLIQTPLTGSGFADFKGVTPTPN